MHGLHAAQGLFRWKDRGKDREVQNSRQHYVEDVVHLWQEQCCYT